MLSDAYVEVTCDGCHAIEIVTLTATGHGNSWDERDVARRIQRLGWVLAGDCHYCNECKENH